VWDVAGRGKEKVVDQLSLMNSISKIALPTRKEHVDNLKPTGMIALPGSGYTFGEGGMPRRELFGTAALSLETRAPSDDFRTGRAQDMPSQRLTCSLSPYGPSKNMVHSSSR
jgi:hypothetical protein